MNPDMLNILVINQVEQLCQEVLDKKPTITDTEEEQTQLEGKRLFAEEILEIIRG